MVAEANRRIAADDRVRVDCRRGDWRTLTDAFPSRSFDAVLCIGSSIAHAGSPDDLAVVLASFRSLLADDGLLIVDTRDWEVSTSAEPVREIEPVLVERNDRLCRRSYEWHQPAAAGPVQLVARLEFLDDEGAVTESRQWAVHQTAFTRRQLRTALDAIGFRSITLDRIPGDDRYTATARR